MFYDNILACIYNFYKRFEKGDPHYKAVGLTALCQMLAVVFVLTVLKYYFNMVPPYRIKDTVVFLIAIIWILLLTKFYSRQKVTVILGKYNNKSVAEKYVWGSISLLSFFLPFITLFILFGVKP